MAKKKESNPGPPAWYLEGKAFEAQVNKNQKVSVAEQLVKFAESRNLSPRMLKRYAVLASFIDQTFPEHVVSFRDQTPFSSIEELLKLHKLDAERAASVAADVVSGELIAADMKALAEQVATETSGRLIDGTRSEARKAAFELRAKVEALVLKHPEKFGLEGKFETLFCHTRIKPDLAFEAEDRKVVAIEIRYFSTNSAEASIQQALMKVAWLQSCTSMYQHVVLAVNKEAGQKIEQYRDEYETSVMWPLNLVLV